MAHERQELLWYRFLSNLGVMALEGVSDPLVDSALLQGRGLMAYHIL